MFISVNEAATKFNISKRRVQILCEQGRIGGANMVDGVWLIPDTALKPIDKRRKIADENQMSIFDTQNALTIDDLCKVLSISKATAKNWIRLNRITPDIEGELFSEAYVSQIVADIRSDNSTKLKRRRNKKGATGRVIYKDYVHTYENQQLVEELLEIGIIQSPGDLLVILANFAIQLFYQSRGIPYGDNNVLLDFLSKNNTNAFFALISDLLKNQKLSHTSVDRLQPILSKEIKFVKGEDSLGFIYISLKDIGKRRSSGVYFTPEKIVNALIDNLFDSESQILQKNICDPCCGTGNFLLGLALKGIDCTCLYGQDIDPVNIYITRINIALMFPEIGIQDLYSHFIIGNTYFETFEQKFDVILGNPPWGSDFSDEDALKCRNSFKTAGNKNLESYDIFLEKGLSMLCANGILAFVLPESVLSVAAHDTIRRILLSSCSFRFVSYLGNVFRGVQCPAIILGVSLSRLKSVVGCKVSGNKNSFVIAHNRNFSDGILAFNVSDEDDDCLRAIYTIQDVAYLKGNAKFALGIVTGDNKEYIATEKKDGYEVVLKGSDIQKYGTKPAENYIRFVPELFQQVAPTEIYRAKEKLLYRFISEVPVFAYDDAQTLSLNSCNIVIPEIPGLEMKYVLAILNSSVAAYFMSKKFNSVKALRSHIEQIPIPVVPLNVQESFIKKVDCIMNASENISGLYEELDYEVMSLYNLSARHLRTIQAALASKSLFLRI